MHDGIDGGAIDRPLGHLTFVPSHGVCHHRAVMFWFSPSVAPDALIHRRILSVILLLHVWHTMSYNRYLPVKTNCSVFHATISAIVCTAT